MLNGSWNWAINAFYGAVGVYALGVGLLYVLQNKMVYVPRVPGLPPHYTHKPDAFRMEYEDVWLTSEDGVKIHCWFMWPEGWDNTRRQKRPVILFFQENAGNLSMRLEFLRRMTNHCNCSVFAVSYRGYGPSKGSPTEAGLRLDSQAALHYLLAREDIARDKIVVYGRSLGGAVALHLAAANPGKIRCAVIENTFTSIPDLAPYVAPFLAPLVGRNRIGNLLIRNKWNNLAAAAALREHAVLWISGLKDEMLPPSQMLELYRSGGGTTSWEWHEYSEGHHMDIFDLYRQHYWDPLAAFINRYTT